MKHLLEVGTTVFINNPDHMTKMAAESIAMKLDMYIGTRVLQRVYKS